MISDKTGMKTVNTVLLREVLSPDMNSLQYTSFAMNAMKI